MVFTTVAANDFMITQGSEEVGRFASTDFGERCFCKSCGSPLTIHVRHQLDEIDVSVGTLDEPGAVTSGFHLDPKQAPHWILDLYDGLPRSSSWLSVPRPADWRRTEQTEVFDGHRRGYPLGPTHSGHR